MPYSIFLKLFLVYILDYLIIGNTLSYHQFTRLLMFQTGLIGVPNYFHIGLSAKCLSVSCTYENNSSLLSSFNFGSVFIFKRTQRNVSPFLISLYYFWQMWQSIKNIPAFKSNSMLTSSIVFVVFFHFDVIGVDCNEVFVLS